MFNPIIGSCEIPPATDSAVPQLGGEEIPSGPPGNGETNNDEDQQDKE
ncbi:MAG: hypothetical protein WA941_15775 [Nitrososphaeraceae archaeon]